MHFNDDTIYEGEWKNDHRWGHGKLTFDDESYYEGDFYKGMQHGNGKKV